MKTFLFLSLVFWGSLPARAADRVPVDGFAAMVNGQVITAGDVLEATVSQRRQLRQRLTGRELNEALGKAFDEGLDRLIENRLILESFAAMDGKLPEGAVRERMDSILRDRFDNNRAQLLSTLRQVGKSEREWENELRDQVIVQQMTQQFVTRRINVTPRMLRDRYEERAEDFQRPVELHLWAISLRPVPADQLPARRAFLQDLHNELTDGADFAETARRVSQGANAAGGGDQGWLALDGLPAELRDALRDLEPGELSPPVITPTQHYLFKVVDRRGGERKPLGEVQAQLENELRRDQFETLHREWIDGLKRRFPVVRYSLDQEPLQQVR